MEAPVTSMITSFLDANGPSAPVFVEAAGRFSGLPGQPLLGMLAAAKILGELRTVHDRHRLVSQEGRKSGNGGRFCAVRLR